MTHGPEPYLRGLPPNVLFSWNNHRLPSFNNDLIYTELFYIARGYVMFDKLVLDLGIFSRRTHAWLLRNCI